MFNITSNTSLIEIKEASCRIWGYNPLSYDLYDDMFNNINNCYEEKVLDLMHNEIGSDSTNNGIVVFYLIEKLRKNTDFYSSNNLCMKKAKNNNDFLNKQLFVDNNLLNFIEMFKNEKILKGIHHYKTIKSSNRRSYLNTVRKFDNWLIFPILIIAYIILAIISISNKIVDDTIKFSSSNDNLINEKSKQSSLKFEKSSFNYYLISYLNEILDISENVKNNETNVIGKPTIRIVSKF